MSNTPRVAAGFVIYKRNYYQEVQFLLLQASYGDFHYSPPKGFVKGNESNMETALRVTEEETGIKAKDIEIYHDFQETLEYTPPSKGYERKIYYWLARLIDPLKLIRLTDDHQAFAWWTIDDVLKHIEYIEMKNLLFVCHHYLNTTVTKK